MWNPVDLSRQRDQVQGKQEHRFTFVFKNTCWTLSEQIKKILCGTIRGPEVAIRTSIQSAEMPGFAEEPKSHIAFSHSSAGRGWGSGLRHGKREL